MNKRFRPSKDMVIAMLSVCCIGTIGGFSIESTKLNEAEKKIVIMQEEISNNGKELQFRDDVLDAKRRELDAKDAELEEKNSAIEEKDKKIDELNNIISEKNSKIKSLQNKEFPTQVASNNKERTRQGTQLNMTLTFYGDFSHENGGYAGIDAQGNKLVGGTVASNVYPFGTQFIINGQTFTVNDRGGGNFNSSNRLDVFVPRMKGESDAEYSKRISNYGVKKVTAQKI